MKPASGLLPGPGLRCTGLRCTGLRCIGRRHGGDEAQRGLALLVVLLVLLALLVLAAPFLWMSSESEAAAQRESDRTLVDLALEDAARSARYGLWALHDEFDPTPLADDLEELRARLEPLVEERTGQTAQQGSLDGARFDHEGADLAGRVDLWSAAPQLLANLLGRAGTLARPLGQDDDELRLSVGGDFAPRGWLMVGGEVIGYRERAGSLFSGLERGVGASDEGCGPAPPSVHPIGASVIALEALQFATWRLQRELEPTVGLQWSDVAGEIAALLPPPLSVDTRGRPLEELFEAEDLGGLMDRAFDGTASFDAGYTGGRAWQRAQRVLQLGSPCSLQVREWRWFNPGASVRVRSAAGAELGLVVSVAPGRVRLLSPLQFDHPAFETEVEVLSRRPINVNTASAALLEHLFRGVALVNTTERVTGDEASRLAADAVELRPFDGFQDFAERLLLPAGGFLIGEAGQDADETRRRSLVLPDGYLERDDVIALYANALNANDSSLAFSTAPLSFEARSLFELELRASVARGETERAQASRRQVEHVLPQVPLVELWDRQIDFDEALRLDRQAPGWGTGPRPTSVYDGTRLANPPPRRFAHLNIDTGEDGQLPVARTMYAAEDENGYARPLVARMDDAGQRQGRMLHFDRSTNSAEGFDLATGGGYGIGAARDLVGWELNGLLRPFSLSFWADLSGVTDGTLFEFGDNLETERVRLALNSEALQLELIDAVGDHPATALVERLDLTLDLNNGPAGGLLDGWTHFELDVSGVSPDRVDLRIDGMGLTDPDNPARITRGGLTALRSALSAADTTIEVESTAGFPARCVLRIGNELIEARVVSESSFDATHVTVGEEAGFGGRFARERATYVAGQDLPEITAIASASSTNYSIGTPVALYGYSLRLTGNVPSGSTQLAGNVGPFAAGFVSGIDGGGTGEEVAFEATTPDGNFYTIPVGRGIDDEAPQTLELQPLDANATVDDVLGAFSDSGGYGAILQQVIAWSIGGIGVGEQDSTNGLQLGGVQVFRYSGKSGGSLEIAEWAVGSGELPSLAANFAGIGFLDSQKAFVIEWGGLVLEPEEMNGRLDLLPIVVPISLPVVGAQDALLPPDAAGQPQFLQLVEPDDAELTEWVHYDTLLPDHVLRASGQALFDLYSAATSGGPVQDTGVPGGTGPGTGEPGGGGEGPPPIGGIQTSASFAATSGASGAPGSGFASAPAAPSASAAPAATAPAPAAPAPAAQQAQFWTPVIGTEPDRDWPASRALRSALDFRGVLGTFAQAHVAGTRVTPVWRAWDPGNFDSNPQYGWPGRFDAVFLVDPQPNDPGFPGVVHRAHRPNNRPVYGWIAGPGRTSEAAGSRVIQVGGDSEFELLISLDDALGVPMAPGTLTEGAGDARQAARVLKFPSGELPRPATELRFGATIAQSPGAAAVIDEVVFGASDFGAEIRPLFDGDEGAGMVLALALGDSEQQLVVDPRRGRLAEGDVAMEALDAGILDGLPADGGLLQIGEELVLYARVDAGQGTLEVAPGGRGVLGTRAQPHAIGETIRFLHAAEASRLTDSLSGGDDELPIVDPLGFGPEGTVLIDEELVHYSWVRGTRLGMPRRSSEPGRGDGQGPGIFRGRFGTQPADHALDAVVLRFPFRYWDTAEPQSDAPEQHYFSLGLGVPDAFVEGFAFEASSPAAGTVRLGVLQRASPDVPWDGVPGITPGLELFYTAPPDAGLQPLGRQTNLAEWRVFVEHAPGSFDARGGLVHGWKQVPSLELFVAGYFGAGRVLSAWSR